MLRTISHLHARVSRFLLTASISTIFPGASRMPDEFEPPAAALFRNPRHSPQVYTPFGRRLDSPSNFEVFFLKWDAGPAARWFVEKVERMVDAFVTFGGAMRNAPRADAGRATRPTTPIGRWQTAG